LNQIVSHPILNNAGDSIFNAVSALPIYSPTLSSAPNDWSLAVNVSGGGLNGPASIAIDSSGLVWVSNVLGNSLSAFRPDGSAISPAQGFTGNGLSGPQGIVVDKQNRVWVANWAQGSGQAISIFNPDGSAATGSPIASTQTTGVRSIYGAIDLALDPSGDVWVANYGNSTLSKYSSGNLSLSLGPVSGGGLSFPVKISMDDAGNIWGLNASNGNISEFLSNGTPVQNTAYQIQGINSTYFQALTGNGNLWVSSDFDESLTQFVGGNTPSNACSTPAALGQTTCIVKVINQSAYQIQTPTGIAVDGADNAWVANTQANGVLRFDASGVLLSKPGGHMGGGLLQPTSLAIDASGNVWIINYAGNSLTKIIGMAVPVATPIQGQPKPL
jgi:streptogramin lyase